MQIYSSIVDRSLKTGSSANFFLQVRQTCKQLVLSTAHGHLRTTVHANTIGNQNQTIPRPQSVLRHNTSRGFEPQ